MYEVNATGGFWDRALTLEAASAAVRAHIEANGLGASQWTGTGKVRETVSRKVVARVAYNGKVFGPGPWVAGAVPLYDPTTPTPATSPEDAAWVRSHKVKALRSALARAEKALGRACDLAEELGETEAENDLRDWAVQVFMMHDGDDRPEARLAVIQAQYPAAREPRETAHMVTMEGSSNG